MSKKRRWVLEGLPWRNRVAAIVNEKFQYRIYSGRGSKRLGAAYKWFLTIADRFIAHPGPWKPTHQTLANRWLEECDHRANRPLGARTPGELLGTSARFVIDPTRHTFTDGGESRSAQYLSDVARRSVPKRPVHDSDIVIKASGLGNMRISNSTPE